MRVKSLVRGFAAAVVLSALAAALSCGGSPTSPSSCNNGPYTFDANVQRCRASNGQFAVTSCCPGH
jgi:hypothetical protein